ncbi:MAG TPA: alpha/beta fold hydrolase [Ktedonobacteraceae bacterium]|nr:alpha/beta fold hydrolase [Ktedonobacteraceae bacterium]
MLQKRSTRSNILKVAFGAGAALALTGLVLKASNRSSIDEFAPHSIDPATDYETAMARYAKVQAQDDADGTLNPVCCSKLLTHGIKTERVIVLMHGMTNCPQQFVELAPILYEQGYNVLIPRMPHNGLANPDTDDLKYLTAAELRDCSNSMVDIAHGMGDHITFLGLSVGGLMAAWVAQYRDDVNKAVIMAPSFTISPNLGVRISKVIMQLFLILPNIMTQRLKPFKDGPDHNYLGFATRGLGEMMRFGFSIYDTSKNTSAAAQSVLVITNAADAAVNNNIPLKIAKNWQTNGLKQVDKYEFDAHYKLIHDLIDPGQKQQNVAVTYPVLLDLLARDRQVII